MNRFQWYCKEMHTAPTEFCVMVCVLAKKMNQSSRILYMGESLIINAYLFYYDQGNIIQIPSINPFGIFCCVSERQSRVQPVPGPTEDALWGRYFRQCQRVCSLQTHLLHPYQ